MTRMFYCLKDNYLLRGWDKLPTGVVKRMSGDLMAKDETACAFYRDGWYEKVKKLIEN